MKVCFFMASQNGLNVPSGTTYVLVSLTDCHELAYLSISLDLSDFQIICAEVQKHEMQRCC